MCWVRRRGKYSGCRKRRVKQTCGENGNRNSRGRGSAAQADRGEISDDNRAAPNYEKDEAAEVGILIQRTGNHVPKPREIEPLPVSKRKRPWILEGDIASVPQQVSGRQMPTQIVVAKQQLRVRQVVHASE